MQAHPEMFASNAIETVRNYLLAEGHLKDDLRQAVEDDYQRYGPPPEPAPEPNDDKGVGEVDKRLQDFKLNESKMTDDTPLATLRVPSDSHPCPSPIIPDEEIKKTYHSHEHMDLSLQGQIEGEDVIKVGKSVRFEDGC